MGFCATTILETKAGADQVNHGGYEDLIGYLRFREFLSANTIGDLANAIYHFKPKVKESGSSCDKLTQNSR